MGTPSKESYNAGKQYRTVIFLNDRYAQDFEFNELQAMQDEQRDSLGSVIFHAGAITEGFVASLPGSGQLTLGEGRIWAFGRVEAVPGATLTYDPAKVTGEDIVYVKWLLDQVTLSQDATLGHAATGEAVSERLRTQATLVTSTPDLFDETFELFDGDVPLNWTKVSGGCGIGYPAKFGRQSLSLTHTNGTETMVQRSITLTPGATTYVYFWVRTQDGYTDLQLAHGAYVDFTRTSPAWNPTDFAFSSTKQWVRYAFTVTADANADPVLIRVVIPSTAPTTQVLIDGLLVTTSALGALDVERHYIPIKSWDRATDAVSNIVARASKIPMKELTPPLPGEDIAGIDRNDGLQELLARRTYAENGHFRVPGGLVVRRGPAEVARDTETHLGLLVTPGLAFVRGYECRVPVETPLLIERALDYDVVTGENDAFAFGTNLYELNKSVGVDVFPIKQITQLRITYEQVVSVTKGADGSVDDTGIENVSAIQAVTMGTAGQLTGNQTTFTFTESAKTFTVSVSPYTGGAVGSAQSIVFARGTHTLTQVLEALNSGSGPAYRSGKIVGNVVFTDDGAGHVRVSTKTRSNASTVTIGSGDANSVLGFTNGASNTGTGTHYTETTSWVRSGDSVDWVAGQSQPSNGQSYSVVVRSTETLVLNTDYKLGGAFAAPLTGAKYKVTAVVSGTESQQAVPSAAIDIAAGDIIRVSWSAVGSAQSYGVYRSDDGVATFKLLKFVDGSVTSFLDDGSLTPNASVTPPGSGAAGPTSTTVARSNVGVMNLNPQGKMPVDGSNLVADYEYYQPHLASIVIDQKKTITAIEGDPADKPAPPLAPSEVMELAQCFVHANSDTVTILNLKKYDRVPMADIRMMVDRVNDLTIADLRQSVLNDLLKIGDSSTHKGRVAEGFSDEAGSDLTYDAGGVTSNVGLVPSLKFATLQSTYTKTALTRNAGATTAVAQGPTDWVLPSVENVVINQPLYSEYRPINPYLGSRIPKPTIILSPRTLGWAFAMDAGVSPQQRTARTYTLLAGLWKKVVDRFLPPWSNDAEVIQQTARNDIRKHLETLYTFQNEALTVTVEGHGFTLGDGVGETNIAGSFGGVAVDLTPVSPTVAGATVNGKTTVNADIYGRFTATFVIPVQLAGTQEMLVKGAAGKTASTPFTSLSDILPHPLPFSPHLQAYGAMGESDLIDPVAESIGPFAFGATISAIDLRFSHSAGLNPATFTRPVFLQIRTMENGFPTRQAIVTKVLSPSEITWNGVTKVELPQWLTLKPGEQVAVTVLTADARYLIATATRLQKDQNGKKISQNPNPLGVYFQSSNGATWESLQDTGLFMKVYCRSFNASAVLEFNSVDATNFHRMVLLADQSAPDGTAIQWEYVLNGGRTYQISPSAKFRPPTTPSSVVLRARLSRTNVNVSPRICLPSVALVGMTKAATGTWISPAVSFSQTLSNALAIMTAYIPAGTTLTLYVSRDDGATWTQMDGTVDIIPIDTVWSEYQWNTPKALGGDAGVKKLRVRVDMTSSSGLNYGPLFSRIGIALT